MDSAPRRPEGAGAAGAGAGGAAPAKPAAAAGAAAAPPSSRAKPKPVARTVKPAKAGPTRPIAADAGIAAKTPEQIAESRRRSAAAARDAYSAQAAERRERRETGAPDPGYVRTVGKLHKRAAKFTGVSAWELDKEDQQDAAEAWEDVFSRFEWRPAPGASKIAETIFALLTIYKPILWLTFLRYFGPKELPETERPAGAATPAPRPAASGPIIPMPGAGAAKHAPAPPPPRPAQGHFPNAAPAGTVPGAKGQHDTGGAVIVGLGTLPTSPSPAPSTLAQRMDDPA
jgi:hypothetical protein